MLTIYIDFYFELRVLFSNERKWYSEKMYFYTIYVTHYKGNVDKRSGTEFFVCVMLPSQTLFSASLLYKMSHYVVFILFTI